MVTVVRWTGREARALRTALRMSGRDFANHTGLSTSAIADLEAKGEQAQLRHATQQILDDTLAKASDEARQRFCAILGDTVLRSTEANASEADARLATEAGPGTFVEVESRLSHSARSLVADAPTPVWLPDLGDARDVSVRLWHHELTPLRSHEPDSEAVNQLMRRWLVARPELSASHAGERRIRNADVERLRSVRRQLKAVDDAHGGGTAFPMTVAFLRHEAAPLLHGRYDDATGRALFGAVAELTCDLGWMAYDAGDHPLARAYLGQSLRLAHAADDRLFGGRVLTAMSHQALHVGQFQLAVDCAGAARARTEQIAPARARAMMTAMEAMAWAATKEGAACLAALRDAETALEHADGGNDPAWLDFDEGGLWGHAARAYRYLGKGHECVRYAEQAIALCRSDHGRTRAQRFAILAAGHVRAGDLDQAAAGGELVVREAWRLRSRHVDEEVVGLAEVVRRGNPRGGQDFLTQAEQYLDARPAGTLIG